MSTPSQSPPEERRLHLAEGDFDAYLPERAASNAHTRPRLELKQRMLAWGRGVTQRLAELNIDAEITGSDEFPNLRNGRRVDSQRVFFWRDAPAREELEQLIDHKRSLSAVLGDPTPHKKHAYLALKIDAQCVEVSIEIHPEAWVDVRNVRDRLAQAERALALTTAFESLPEQYTYRVGNGSPRPVQGVDSTGMREALDVADETKQALWIGWSVPRVLAVRHSALLDEQLEDALVALAPVYRLMAWARDNDCIGIDREWSLARAERAKAHEEAERERVEWEVQREDETRREQGRRRSDRHRRAEGSDRRTARETPRSVVDPVPPQARPSRMPLVRSDRLRPKSVRVVDVDATASLERGARVQVMSGPFEGKVGSVQDLDGRGGVRVLLGLLAVRLDVKELGVVRETRERPTLSSSHRKPGLSRTD